MEKEMIDLLDAITWGRRIVEVEDNTLQKRPYVMRPLTLEEKNIGNYVYESARRDAVKNGLLTKDQLTKNAIKHDVWKAAYAQDLVALRDEFDKTKKALKAEEEAKMVDSKGRRIRRTPTPFWTRLDKKLHQITSTIIKLDRIHTEHIELPSVEYQSEYARGIYCLHCAVMSFPDMIQLWPTTRHLDDERDTILVNNLMRAYYNDSIADESTLRAIARSGFWRSKWMGSKKNAGVRTLFNRDMYDLTIDQYRLVYWSQVYDSAYESMEPPSDKVIDDDKLFDRWLEEQHKKREQERKQSAFDKKVSKLDKKGDAHEVSFSVLGEYSEECTCGIREQADALGYDKRGHIHAPSCSYGVFLYYTEDKKSQKVEEIQSTNPDSVRKLLATEQKRLAALGPDGAEEQVLRGDKARKALGMGTKYHGAGELGKGQKGRA